MNIVYMGDRRNIYIYIYIYIYMAFIPNEEKSILGDFEKQISRSVFSRVRVPYLACFGFPFWQTFRIAQNRA